MATRKRTGKKPAQKPEAKKTVEFSPDRRVTVSVGTSSEYGKAKINLSLSENIKNDADMAEFIDETFEALTEKLEEKFEELQKKFGEEDSGDDYEDESSSDDDDWDDEDTDEPDSDDEDDEDTDDDDDDEDLTEDDILSMKKSELIELIEEEGLDDINTKMKIKDLREAVIDALFEPEDDKDTDDDDDWDDGDWDDDE